MYNPDELITDEDLEGILSPSGLPDELTDSPYAILSVVSHGFGALPNDEE